MKPHRHLSEQAMCTLEENIPLMAQAAFELARLNALTVSGKVLEVFNGQLVELSAEGDIRVIKAIQPSFKVKAGTKLDRKNILTMTSLPRLRIFAGPNGSGKSTLKDVLPADLLGVYVNADDIEKNIRLNGRLKLDTYSIQPTHQELVDFLSQSTLFDKAGLKKDIDQFHLDSESIVLRNLTVNSYHASVIGDFIRHQLLLSGQSMTFETVMSSRDKIAFIRKAQKAGYRTYLYFVATEDPLINISRIFHRVKNGGHDVPSEKVIARYARSLSLLSDAISCTDKTYLFDNSGYQKVWIAEVSNGEVLELHTDAMPNWFRHALSDQF